MATNEDENNREINSYETEANNLFMPNSISFSQIKD